MMETASLPNPSCLGSNKDKNNERSKLIGSRDLSITDASTKSLPPTNLEQSLQMLDDIFTDNSSNYSFSYNNSTSENDLESVSSAMSSVVSSATSLSGARRLGERISSRVSKFSGNQNSLDIFPSQYSMMPPPPRQSPKKAIENKMRTFEGKNKIKNDVLLSPSEVKRLVKLSKHNNRLDPILDRYEHLWEEDSQHRRELAANIAARERQRRLGCTKSKEERVLLLEQSRARFFGNSNGSNAHPRVAPLTKRIDINSIFEKKNDTMPEAIRATRYDFTGFVPPFFKKTKSQRKLLLNIIERSFIFEQFRTHGKARSRGAVEALIGAFETLTLEPGHVLRDERGSKENDKFYILEDGKIDIQSGKKKTSSNEVGAYFGELGLLYNVASKERISVHGSSGKARFLSIDQKVFRGVSHVCLKEAQDEKRNALMNVDFLQDFLNENEKMVNRLTSIMQREEMVLGEEVSVSQDTTFVLVQSGQLNVSGINQTLNPGDYFGSKALVGSLPYQSEAETELIASSKKVVYFSIDNFLMEQIVGPSRFRKLMDMHRFSLAKPLKKLNLTEERCESMADRIVEKHFEEEEDDTWEIRKNDPPAMYLVSRGSLLVTSHDKYTGDEVNTLVGEGTVFGSDQVRMSSKEEHPTYRRTGGLKASVPKGQSASVSVLPLDKIKPDSKEESSSPTSVTGASFHDQKGKESDSIESSELEVRAKVREIVGDNVTLDDFEKIRLLGEGEFGEVWMVSTQVFPEETPETLQKFALKTQKKFDHELGIDSMDSIFREIQMMKDLRHPQLVDLVTSFQDETHVHMLMRLLPYGELWERIHIEDENGDWSSGLVEDHAKFYALSLGDTLNFMHSKGIIYRDLKPENVLIDVHGYPVIADFGFAKRCSDKTHTFVGTSNYIAPEIITNAGHNRSVDIWALGITTYEMVMGENPFYYDDMEHTTLYHTICYENYYPLKSDTSKSLVDFIERILKKDPVERLGMLAGGMNDIFDHEWFDGLDLEEIRRKTFPAPWKPTEIMEDGFEHVKVERRAPQYDPDSSFGIDSIAEEDCSISPKSQSKTKRTKKKKIKNRNSPVSKKAQRKIHLIMPEEPVSNSLNASVPEDFKYTYAGDTFSKTTIRNPTTRRTSIQREESKRRRDLLKSSLYSFGID